LPLDRARPDGRKLGTIRGSARPPPPCCQASPEDPNISSTPRGAALPCVAAAHTPSAAAAVLAPGNYIHIPPYNVTAASTKPLNTYWVFLSVPSNYWTVWAGCEHPYSCAGSGNSLEGQWAVITRDGIDIGPTIIGDQDKAMWKRWATKAQTINFAAHMAAKYFQSNPRLKTPQEV